MTALAHIPNLPNIVTFAVIVWLLAIGFVWWLFRTATLVDEDEQPVGGRR